MLAILVCDPNPISSKMVLLLNKIDDKVKLLRLIDALYINIAGLDLLNCPRYFHPENTNCYIKSVFLHLRTVDIIAL